MCLHIKQPQEDSEKWREDDNPERWQARSLGPNKWHGQFSGFHFFFIYPRFGGKASKPEIPMSTEKIKTQQQSASL